MSENQDLELEELIARKLRALPDQIAPQSLASSVLATLRARQAAPWWRRSWFQWPASLRIASAGLAFAITGLLLAAALHYWPDAAARYDSMAQNGSTWIAAFTTWLDQATLQARAHLDTVPASFWFAAGGFVSACYLMCIGLGTAFVRYFIFSKQTLRS
jgi:hypothetical protein